MWSFSDNKADKQKGFPEEALWNRVNQENGSKEHGVTGSIELRDRKNVREWGARGRSGAKGPPHHLELTQSRILIIHLN